MSRQQANKSRGEKGASRGGGGPQSVSVPAVTNDLIPGRLTVADWTKTLTCDDDEDFIGSVVEDIVETSLEECYQKYVWKQVLPYTVHQAKVDLLDLIEWRFLSHDIGEINVFQNPGWAEDAEPEPGIIDSWAQGSVPIIVTKSPEPKIFPVIEEKAAESPTEDQTVDVDHSESISIATRPSTSKEKEPTGETLETSEQQATDESKDQKSPKKRVSYKRYIGRLTSAHVGDMTKTLERSESEMFEREFSHLNPSRENMTHLSPSQKSLLKLQAGRPPGNKEVTFDEKGNVIAVMKLDKKSLPSHKVRVNYSIIDPEAEAAAQRLEAMRTGKLRTLAKIQWRSRPNKAKLSPRITVPVPEVSENPVLKLQPLPAAVHSSKTYKAGTRSTQRSTLTQSQQKKDKSLVSIKPLPPSLIESIDASPGVVITEGGQVKTGNKAYHLRPLQHTSLVRHGKINNSAAQISNGERTLRMLGSGPTTDNRQIDDRRLIVHPILSPSHVIGTRSPTVRTPFSVPKPVPPMN